MRDRRSWCTWRWTSGRSRVCSVRCLGWGLASSFRSWLLNWPSLLTVQVLQSYSHKRNYISYVLYYITAFIYDFVCLRFRWRSHRKSDEFESIWAEESFTSYPQWQRVWCAEAWSVTPLCKMYIARFRDDFVCQWYFWVSDEMSILFLH